MASPTFETFCCENATHPSPYSYKSTLYNSLSLSSATVSILGASLQLCLQITTPRTHSCNDSLRRIIRQLAVADLLACLGVLVRSAAWLGGYSPDSNDDRYANVFCALVEVWIHLFYVCTYVWTFMYALEFRIFVQSEYRDRVPYSCVAWFIGLLITCIGLFPLYFPLSIKCAQHTWYNVVPHYLSTYVPICAVLLLNPVLYYLSVRDVRLNLISNMIRYTEYERNVVLSVRRKFQLIIIVFSVCWSPNLLNGILLWLFSSDIWHSPKWLCHGLWAYMAVVNPLQAFLNVLVYRRSLLKHYQVFRGGPSPRSLRSVMGNDSESICSTCVANCQSPPPLCCAQHVTFVSPPGPADLEVNDSEPFNNDRRSNSTDHLTADQTPVRSRFYTTLIG